jgi:hypothetical protein
MILCHSSGVFALNHVVQPVRAKPPYSPPERKDAVGMTHSTIPAVGWSVFARPKLIQVSTSDAAASRSTGSGLLQSQRTIQKSRGTLSPRSEGNRGFDWMAFLLQHTF